METAHSTNRLETMQTSWEDILAAMDKNSALVRLSRRYPKEPPKHHHHLVTKPEVQLPYKEKPGQPSKNGRAPNGRSYADFLPVSDDEETIADDFEGFMDYNSSSAFSKSEAERGFSRNSGIAYPKNVISRKTSLEPTQNQHIQISRVNSDPHRAKDTKYTGGVSTNDRIRSKKKPQLSKNVMEPQESSDTHHRKTKTNINDRNEENLQLMLKSKAKEAFCESSRNDENKHFTQRSQNCEADSDPDKRRIVKKRARKKNTFGNSKIKEVLEEVESAVNEREARVPPISNSPNSALDQPKSPTDFLEERNNFSSHILNNASLDKQRNQEPFPTSTGYHTDITPHLVSTTPGSSKTPASHIDENDVMKVVISSKNNNGSMPMFFHRMDFGAPIKSNPPQKGDKNTLRYHQYPNLKDYFDLEWLQDEHSTDSSHLFASPASTNNSQSSQFLASTSSRSSSLWSKYEDIDQNNIAQYAYILRKYGGSLDLEPKKISHIQKNKMDLSSSKKSTSKSYAMDHAKRMLIKLKNVTGNDFELLHERELEDEIISGVKAPKKLPPLGIVNQVEFPSNKKYEYKPNSLKDFRALPKVRTVPAGSNLTEQQLREMVERAEKKKTLDQAIRERNREMFGQSRHVSNSKATKPETTAPS